MVFGLIASAISGVVGAISAIGSSILGLGVGPFLGIVNLAIGIAKLLSPKNQIEPRDYERFSYTANIKDKKPENYEDVSSYISDVKNSMKELTPEEEQKLGNLSETEKKRYKSNTIATIFQAFGEELGLKEPISFGAIKGAAEIKMNPTEFKKMVEDYKNNKIPTMDVDAYLDNKLDADDDVAMYDYLKEKLDKMG
ncbi:hypothetical protein BCB68_09575 [Leptotrichia sp. oral taxon 498]|uniref:hypothetical protein n=1 Tax=Leptotrichia sp. oral taxon 498 TaxID=712368 RepID=UPI000B8CFF9E|nr:hypothetical protein [Leptotrichia sp. oral taxon 498]ASQ49150.1 hypothetical protein BCB68_09575 [Leptotrichia sp. oral taxon 498]